MDMLSYSYSGNQLTHVNDSGDKLKGFKDGSNDAVKYSYDANGNLTADKSNKISSIGYNVLNKPETITFEDGRKLYFSYSASGEKLSFMEIGYDIQKFVSPVALHVDVRLGIHQRGIGVDASVGIPKAIPISYRVHGGVSYYSKNYDVQSGFETRYGAELSAGFGLVSWGGTHYNSPGGKFDQTTNYVMLGVPGFNFKYENDYFFDLSLPFIPRADGGDRHCSAAAKLQVAGFFDIGINLLREIRG